MGVAILPVHLSMIEGALHLPEGYHIVSAYYRIEYNVVTFLIESDTIPSAPTGAELPRLDLLTTVHWLPEDTTYRKYSVEVKVRE